jgi:predicted ATPase with chaperone activity
VFDTEPPRKAAAPIIPRESTDEAPRARLDPRLNEPPMLELKEARWQPKEPRSWEEAGIDEILAEQLVLRYLTTANTESARQIANDICLNLPLTKDLLERLKHAKLLQHRGATPMGDFIYELTDAGRAKAIDYKRICAYVGPAPVPFVQYLQSVEEQTLRSRTPTPDDLQRAFADLIVSSDLVARLGPAVASGRAMFLHGDPGNGKTSIAERVTRCFGDAIWIPHTLLIDGHLVKLYDPATHNAVDPAFKALTPQERLDRRWVKIERPTVVAGGELTLEMLEIQISATTNICEAPLQLKANCGTLVIDDFGRQRIEPQVLLNRWIFPLERRLDFLRLPDGRKISSPFDPLLIFSTNLEPRDLVDEAFLRRIPYKIQVLDPTEGEFRALFELVAAKAEVVLARGVVDHLLDRHYKAGGRKLRFCHPRDIILQVVNQCLYERRPKVATAVDIDRAVDNYFGAL